jgi:hypothetical protein
MTKQFQIDLLCCNIDHQGPANVRQYFIRSELQQVSPSPGSRIELEKQPEDTPDSLSNYCTNSCQYLESSFRGRRLVGVSKKLKTHKIVLMQKHLDSWKPIAHEEEFTIWTHDDKPSHMNSAAMNLESWLQITDLLHSPEP